MYITRDAQAIAPHQELTQRWGQYYRILDCPISEY